MENLFWTVWFYLLVIGVLLSVILSLYELVQWRRLAYDLQVDGVIYEKVRYKVDRKRKEITIYDERNLETVLPYQSYSEIERYIVTKLKEGNDE